MSCEELRVGAVLLDPLLLEPADALADVDAEALAARHLVQELERLAAGAEAELLAAGVALVDDARLEALHDEGDAGRGGDGVDAVGVAVEVELEHEVEVEAAHVGARRPAVSYSGPSTQTFSPW